MEEELIRGRREYVRDVIHTFLNNVSGIWINAKGTGKNWSLVRV